MVDESADERLRALAEHLEATGAYPLDREANRWLGEAESVARDVAGSDPDPETARDRVRQVRRLLSEVDETGHPEADEHVEAARAACADVLGDR